MATSNTKATTNNTFVLADLSVNTGLTNSGIEFGKQFNTVFNTMDKKAGELVTIIKAMIKTTANKPQDFAVMAGGFASKIDRKSWNSVSTFFRTVSKKEGFKVSFTCDRNDKNKKAHLIKASFIKIDIEAEKEALTAKKDKAAKDDAKAAKQHDKDVIAEYVASHGDSIEYPTTQKAIVVLFERLLSESSITTKQTLFATVGANLEILATTKKVEPQAQTQAA